MKLIAFFLLLLSTAIYSQSKHNEVLTNQTIIQLRKAQLSNDILKLKINSSQCEFDLSSDDLINLKKEGVPDDVINAMLAKDNNNTSAENNSNKEQPLEQVRLGNLSSGIYFFDSSKNEYTELEPSLLTNHKTSNIGKLVPVSTVANLINIKSKVSLSGREASQKINTNKPVFVFDSTDKEFNSGYMYYSKVQSPKEFFLVHLEKTNNNREVVIGKSNSIGSNVGIDDKSKMLFSFKKMKNGFYEVTPDNILMKGEYCFMFASSSMYEGLNHKLYDFSIQ